MKIKSFVCPKSIRNYEKNNAWNIKPLVNESFVQATQRPSVSYIEDCRIFGQNSPILTIVKEERARERESSSLVKY